MTSRPRVRVYIACSLDGFIAGAGDDLSWLPGADPGPKSGEAPPSKRGPAPPNDPGAVSYDEFMQSIGAILMGRRSYDVVRRFVREWPYHERPVLVATHHRLHAPLPGVEALSGDIDELVDAALKKAGGRDVYLDGGNLVRQALDADLVDEMIVTMVPVVLGEGLPLFAGVRRRHHLEFAGHYRFGDSMLQVHVRPRRR